MAQGLQALGQALEAAQNAEGGSPCETAYNSIMAMVQAMSKNGGNTPELPSKEEYVAACSELPEATQQCMSPAYAMQHQEDCAAAMQSPEVAALRERFRPGR